MVYELIPCSATFVVRLVAEPLIQVLGETRRSVVLQRGPLGTLGLQVSRA